MNIANILTMLRFILTAIFIVLIRQDGLSVKILALFVFTAAALTDYFDGYLARKYNLITRFGKIMDPIADKFLTLSAFFIFMQMHIIASWMLIIIAVREITVTGLRLMAVQRGVALAAEKAGKVKTVLQIVAVYLIMIFIILAQCETNAQWYANVMSWSINGITLFMCAVVLITLSSGITFIWNNRKEIFNVR